MKIIKANKYDNKLRKVTASIDTEDDIVVALMEYGYNRADAEEIVEDGDYTVYEGSTNEALGESYIESMHGSVDALEDEIREMIAKKYGEDIAYCFNFDAEHFGLTLQTNHGGFIPAGNGWIEVTR